MQDSNLSSQPDAERDAAIIDEMLKLFRLLTPSQQQRLIGVAEGLNMARTSAANPD